MLQSAYGTELLVTRLSYRHSRCLHHICSQLVDNVHSYTEIGLSHNSVFLWTTKGSHDINHKFAGILII